LAAVLFGATFFHRQQPWLWKVNRRPQRFPSRMLVVSVAVLLLLACAQMYAQWGHLRFGSGYVPLAQAKEAVPLRVGPWQLQRMWAEADGSRQAVLQWAEYRREDDAQTVQLGLWLSPIRHFALMSEQSHGRVALWTDAFDALDAAGLPMHFSTFASGDPDDPQSVSYTAEAQCRADGCGAYVAGFSGRGFSFAFGNPGRGKHLEMVLRVPGVATRKGDVVAKEFASHLDMRTVVDKAGSD